jgi:hypothetical protein
MKPRKILVTLTLRTDIPMNILQDKKEWQRVCDQFLYGDSNDVEKVDVKIKESK